MLAASVGIRAQITSSPGFLPFSLTGLLDQKYFTHTNIFMGNVASGDVDFYTVAAGYRAVMIGSTWIDWTNSKINVYPEVKTNGSYFQLNSATQVSTNISSTIQAGGSSNPFVFEQNETVSFHTAGLGLNGTVSLWVFRNSVPLKSPRILTGIATSNTLYTVPSGYEVRSSGFSDALTVRPQVLYWNNSGSSRIFTSYLVPSGGAASASNTFLPAVSFSSGVSNGINVPQMNPGDSIVVTLDANTATQYLWMTVLETPVLPQP